MGSSRWADAEDPAEDVFVSLVHDERDDYRLLEGGWEGAGFYTQVVLDVVATMPDEGPLGQVKRSVRSLLAVSDLLCANAALRRYQVGSGELHSALLPRLLPDRGALISRTRISVSDLADRGVQLADLEPFLLSERRRSDLDRQEARYNHLDRHPLTALTGTHLTVAKPSAVSVAVRDYVISQVLRDEHLTKAFEEKLAEAYSKHLTDGSSRIGWMGSDLSWTLGGPNRFAGFGGQIDAGYFVVVQFFLPTVRTHVDGGFGGTHVVQKSVGSALRHSFEHAARRAAEGGDFKGGVHLVVGCGWGRAQVMEYPASESAKWRFQYVSAADFVRLRGIERVDAKYLWSLLDGVETAERAGLRIANPNGVLNLIGWVQRNDGRFVPHPEFHYSGTVSPEDPLMLQIPADLLRSVRADALQRTDRHYAVDGAGQRHELARSVPDGIFESESGQRVYGSLSALERREFVSVYEGVVSLWAVVSAPNMSESATELRLFEMIGVWLHRIGAALDADRAVTGRAERLTAYVEFLDGDPAGMQVEKPSMADLVPLCRVEEHPEEHACKVVFDVGFLDGFRIAENVAERLVVRTLARAYLRACGAEDEDDDGHAIESAVVLNDEARNFHVFQIDHYHGYVRDSLPGQLVEHEPVDQGVARIGLASCGASVPSSGRIEGRVACTEYLAKVVVSLVEDLTARLAKFSRRPALTRLVLNCEKADAEERRWTMTSAAILGLHGRDPRTIERFVERKSRFAGTRATSRILIEMALCACPSDGGSELSDIEMRQLLARADLVMQIGGASDAIHYNVLRPEVVVSPVGDVLFHDDFGEMVARPVLSRMIREGVIADAPQQRRHYDDPRTVKSAAAPVDIEFLRIWAKEMGFDREQAVNIVGELEQYGLAKSEAVVALTRDRYFELVCTDAVPRQAATKFLNQFSLRSRPRWQEPPSGFCPKDISPWRFGRRLSYMTRPILALDDGDDVDLMVAPAALWQSLTYVFQGARVGRLDRSFFRTKEMRDSWLGKAREGHSFNADVARKLAEAGWNVHQNLGLRELFNRRPERNWGDIDVLAWRDDSEMVLAIECKDLAPARNYSEIAALLSEYQGVVRHGKADKLKRHLDRVSELRENRSEIQRFTGVGNPEVVSCLVCSGPVPMQYAGIDALVGVKVGTIEDVLALVE